LLAPFTVPLIMALARRTENDPVTESSRGDVATGWLASGTGLRIGGQQNGLRVRAARGRAARAGRIKGVKRL
ncbi:MAG: rod shape-determining protein MreD, partial [Actinomycetes bacterium]